MRICQITYIVSDIDKALAFEWVTKYINKEKFQLSFILLNPGSSQLEDFLKEQGTEVHRVICRGKKDWPSAILKSKKLLKQLKADVVHCHLLQANIIGLTAAKMAGVKKRIYTRHHSSLHHVYHRKGIWWDKLANRLATHIVAISGIVKTILTDWEKVAAEKITLIPHGFLLAQFAQGADDRVGLIRQRYQLDGKHPVIGVISRFTEWKGVQFIIPAFQDLLKTYPDAVLMLMNAKGDYEKEIHKLLQAIPEHNYRLISFEPDVAAAYHVMDIFVHVPVDEHSEAFGQIYVEALAAGVPSVFTFSGIAPDFIVDKKNAMVVPFKDAAAISKAIQLLLEDKELQLHLKVNGASSVIDKFDLPVMINNLENLYANN